MKQRISLLELSSLKNWSYDIIYYRNIGTDFHFSYHKIFQKSQTAHFNLCNHYKIVSSYLPSHDQEDEQVKYHS